MAEVGSRAADVRRGAGLGRAGVAAAGGGGQGRLPRQVRPLRGLAAGCLRLAQCAARALRAGRRSVRRHARPADRRPERRRASCHRAEIAEARSGLRLPDRLSCRLPRPVAGRRAESRRGTARADGDRCGGSWWKGDREPRPGRRSRSVRDRRREGRPVAARHQLQAAGAGGRGEAMSGPRDPARRRIAVLWIGALVLVLASVGLAIREEALHRAVIVQQAVAQTDVLAGSVGAALSFNDADAMRQYLGALTRNPQVAAAAIYGADGRQLAVLARPGAAAPAMLDTAETQRVAGRVIVARPVTQQGQALGWVYIETTPEGRSAFIARHTGLVILTLLALLLLSFVTGSAARLTVANARLSEEIEARAAAEEALRQSQKLEALGQLTGGIAHDFNNLLQAIHGAFELILGRSRDENTVKRWATNGLEAAERGASLTRQLLAFSRQQKLELKPLLVGETIEGMQDLLTRTLGPRVELMLDLDAERIPVVSDVTQLEVAVMNLAVNARDAMPEGGRLTIRTRK